MLQQIPSGIVAKEEFSTLEAGKILFIIENLELQNSKAGKLMIKPSLRGMQPASVSNMPHFHYFVIGSDEDPGADLPETWAKNGGRFKTFCTACNVPFDGYPVMQVVQNCIGKQIGAHIKTKIRQSKPGQDNSYDGQVEANVTKWLTPGNFQPELDRETGEAATLGMGLPPTQQQMAAPGQGAFAPPGGMPPSVQPGLPPNQAPSGLPPETGPAGVQQQSFVPPTQNFAPPPPAGPPATPGMEGSQYVPQNAQPAPVVNNPVAPGQGSHMIDPYAPQQPVQPIQGQPANPSLPPGAGLV